MIEEIPQLDALGLRKFGLMMAGFIILMFVIVLPYFDVVSSSVVPWMVALIFVIVALASPLHLKKFYLLWMTFGQLMSRVVNAVVLGTVYLLLVTPLGLCMRLFGWDSLNRRLDSGATSYRVISRVRERSELERPF